MVNGLGGVGAVGGRVGGRVASISCRLRGRDATAAPLSILPDPQQLHLVQFMVTAKEITAIVETSAVRVPCPLCGRTSGRVHSRDVRSVADVPWHGVPFRLRLHVRRLFCKEPTCLRVIFAERLPGLVAPRARRTARRDAWLREVGFALGGEAGTRLLCALGLGTASPDTLLRPVRHTPQSTALVQRRRRRRLVLLAWAPLRRDPCRPRTSPGA